MANKETQMNSIILQWKGYKKTKLTKDIDKLTEELKTEKKKNINKNDFYYPSMENLPEDNTEKPK